MRKILHSLSYMFRILKHPMTVFEEIRYNDSCSIGSAYLILIIFVIVRMLNLGITNFIFNPKGLTGVSLGIIFIQTVVPLLLWVTANYLVSSITKGQGRLRDVFIGTAYALTPYLLFSVPMAIISNIMTMQEVAIYYFFNYGIIVWCGLLMYIQVMIIHGYELGETVINIVGSIFTIAMIIIIGMALSGVVMQNYRYLYSILMEVLEFV